MAPSKRPEWRPFSAPLTDGRPPRTLAGNGVVGSVSGTPLSGSSATRILGRKRHRQRKHPSLDQNLIAKELAICARFLINRMKQIRFGSSGRTRTYNPSVNSCGGQHYCWLLRLYGEC
jgi:hypothetical protein